MQREEQEMGGYESSSGTEGGIDHTHTQSIRENKGLPKKGYIEKCERSQRDVSKPLGRWMRKVLRRKTQC